jgi:hypothetical protein
LSILKICLTSCAQTMGEETFDHMGEETFIMLSVTTELQAIIVTAKRFSTVSSIQVRYRCSSNREIMMKNYVLNIRVRRNLAYLVIQLLWVIIFLCLSRLSAITLQRYKFNWKNATGSWRINLSDKVDRSIMMQLIALNGIENDFTRTNGFRGDTSQHVSTLFVIVVLE